MPFAVPFLSSFELSLLVQSLFNHPCEFDYMLQIILPSLVSKTYDPHGSLFLSGVTNGINFASYTDVFLMTVAVLSMYFMY